MKIKDFFSSNQVTELVKRYNTSGENINALFEKSAEDLSVKNCIIPVLGTQGSGKSSFLNALLFGDIILPVDADETTCIPTAVSYADIASPQVVVVFKDGNKKDVECSEKSLANFVHQDKNPGNKLGVSHIEIKMRHPLLENGITLVDLPGVGSITAENQKTTMDYLKKSTGAIFMLRTVPPMTNSESLFIQAALPLMGKVFWVQNQWIDESRKEVQDGLEHNHQKLREVAEKLHLPEEIITLPSVVNVKKALDGKVTDDEKLISISGIQKFQSLIADFAKDWYTSLESGRKKQALAFLEYTKQSALNREKMLAGNIDEQLVLIRNKREDAEDQQRHNRKLYNSALDYLSEQKKNIFSTIDSQTRISAENLRNAVREIIDNGVVGGERLNKAFGDHQKNENERLFVVLQEEFNKITSELSNMLADLQDCRFEKSDELTAGVNGQFSDKTNAPHYYGRIGGAVGSLGGATGGVWAGAAIGSAVPVIGTAIGAAVGGIIGGILGGLGGWFGGSKAGQMHIANQQDEARQELFKHIEDYQKVCKNNYRQAFSDFKDEIDSVVRKWLTAQDDLIEDNFRKAKNDLNKPIEEKKAIQKQIAEDLLYLQKLHKELEK